MHDTHTWMTCTYRNTKKKKSKKKFGHFDFPPQTPICEAAIDDFTVQMKRLSVVLPMPALQSGTILSKFKV
jgi:hypothetical protein